MFSRVTSSMLALRQLLHNIKINLVATVPDSDAVCEFDCSEVECTQDKWRVCENRLSQLPRERRSVGDLERQRKFPIPSKAGAAIARGA